MDTSVIIEMVGYLGSVLVVVSMLMSSVVKLRVINSVGSCIFAVYALIIHSYPTALMNFCLVAINAYNLMRLREADRHFGLVDGKKDDAFLSYFLDYYKEDIKTFFPDAAFGNAKEKPYGLAYLVCCDAVPAGILLGKEREGGAVEILLDYSTPAYRDCSVGRYLYAKLAEKGVKKLVYAGDSRAHTAYLQKMGFVKEDTGYVKDLSR